MRKLLSKVIVTCFICVLVSSSYAQEPTSDLSFISKKDFHNHKFDKRKVTYLFAENKNPVVKYNPVSLVLGSLMFFYQKVLSPQISANCPYEISCSNFSKLSIKKFGFIKGVALSADRLMRCNRFVTMDIGEQNIEQKSGKIKDDLDKYKWEK